MSQINSGTATNKMQNEEDGPEEKPLFHPWVKYKCQGRSQKKQKGKEFMFNTITQETLWMPDYNKLLLEQNKEKQPEPPTSPSQLLIRKFREYKKWRSTTLE